MRTTSAPRDAAEALRVGRATKAGEETVKAMA